MPEYTLKCDCGHRWEEVCAMSARGGLLCPLCGAKAQTDPRQYQTQAVQREWQGRETLSMDVVFAPDADVAGIKRSCPSMELAPDRFGFLRPVSRNDKHDRQWKKEMRGEVDRHEAIEKGAGVAAPAAAGPATGVFTGPLSGPPQGVVST